MGAAAVELLWIQMIIAKLGVSLSQPHILQGDNQPTLALASNPRTTSSSSLGSMEEKSVKLRIVNLGSLIDLAADPEATPVPASTTNDPILGQHIQLQPAMTLSSSDARNMTLLALPAQDATAPPPNATNTLEFQLSQLSAPAVGCSGSMFGGCDVAPQTSSNPATPSACNNSTLALQPQHVLPFADSFSFQQCTLAAGASNRQGPVVSFITQLQESNGALPQSLVPAKAKPSERKELPEISVYGNCFESFLRAVVIPERKAIEDRATIENEQGDLNHFAKIPRQKTDKECNAPQCPAVGRFSRYQKNFLVDKECNAPQLRGFEMLRAVHLEPLPFDVERDLVTPTFKLKRPHLLK